MLNYALVMSYLMLGCILATLGEMKKAERDAEYAANISIVPIVLNCIWNYTLFLVQFTPTLFYSVSDLPLLLPTILTLTYINFFQLKMLACIWKSRHQTLILSNLSSERIRELVVSFNCKVYVGIVFGVVAVFNVLYIPGLLVCFTSSIWIPQIIYNIWKSKAKAPSILYILVITIEQLFIPV